MIIVGSSVITADFQVEFNGLLMGPGTPYGILTFGGFGDLAAVRSQHNPRPSRNGMYTAPDYEGGKVYDLEVDITANGAAAFVDAVNAFVVATQVQQGLLPLRFRIPAFGDRTTYVQCLRRSLPIGVPYQFGISPSAALQWYAPDARQYGPAFNLSTGLRSKGTGLLYPLLPPYTYGDPPSGGRVTFTNTGTASVEPVITVTGPFALGFEITHAETGRRLRYQAAVGSDLVLDCGEGTCLTQGQERATNLVVREWFSVAPGATATFALASLGSETALSAPTAGMSVSIAPAYT